MFFFFFSSRRRHTRYIGDWSSDVCSSDLSFQPHRQLSLHELSLHAPPKEGPAAIPNPGIYFSHSNCQNSENSVIRAGTSRRNIFWSPLLLCQRPCSDRACSDGAPNMEAACARVRLEGTFVKLSVTSLCCTLIVCKNIALP